MAWGIQKKIIHPPSCFFLRFATIWFGKKPSTTPGLNGKSLNFPNNSSPPFGCDGLQPWFFTYPGSSFGVAEKHGELSSTAGAADGVAEAERSTSIAGFGGSIPIVFLMVGGGHQTNFQGFI